MSDYYIFTDFETTGLDIPGEDLPIELGMVLTDDEYNILDTLSFYINPFKDREKLTWNEHESEAFKVHNVPYSTVRDEGVSPLIAINAIHDMINKQKGVDKYNSRYILMSDNGQMEYNCMQTLFKLENKQNEFPFHWAAWDINILINSVQKVMKGKVPHRALQDAFRMYKVVIRALERNG